MNEHLKRHFFFKSMFNFQSVYFLLFGSLGFFWVRGKRGCCWGRLGGDVQGHLFKANGAQTVLLQKASNQLHSVGG